MPPSASTSLSIPSLLLPTPPSHSQDLNAQPNPRYASHMPPIFTEQWRREQEIAELKRQRDAQQLENASQSKHGVVVYAWSKDNEPPSIHEFQGGWSWPYFKLTPAVLSTVELMGSTETAKPCIQLYRHGLSTWVTIDPGHTIELCAGDRVFLKARHVRCPAGFDDHLRAPSKQATPHLRYNLPRERSYIREKLKGNRKGKEREISEDTIEVTSSDSSISKPKMAKRKRGGGQRRLSPISLLARPLLGSHVKTEPDIELFSDRSPPDVPARKKHKQLPTASQTPPVVILRTPGRRHISPSPKVIEISSDDEDSFLPLFSRFTASPMPSCVKGEGSSTPARSDYGDKSSEDSDCEAPRGSKKKRWPAHYHAVDIVSFFADVSAHPEEKLPSVFKRHFPHATFHNTTYYENRKRWKSARESARDQVLRGKHSDKGLWSSFLKLSRK